MFEAYIGGLYYSSLKANPDHGKAYEVVRGWLWELYTPFAEFFFEVVDTAEVEEDGLAQGAKAELHELWSQYGSKKGWDDLIFTYTAEFPQGGKGEEGRMWSCMVTTADPDGQSW
jgi:hypothetical protein